MVTAKGRLEVTEVTERIRRDAASAADPAAVGPMTRDIPLPPRSLRLGLGPARSGEPVSPVSTPAETTRTEVPLVTSAARGSTAITAADRATAGEPQPQDPPVTKPPVTGKRGAHRAGPPSSLRARTALIAVAAGAAAAAVAGSSTHETTVAADPAPAGDSAPAPALAANTSDLNGGAVPAAAGADMTGYTDQLKIGKQLSAEQAARENAARKPLYDSPIPLGHYAFTSGFAMRWGTMHTGLDFAAPLGTPIHAVTDGTIVKAGPASGFGNWIWLKAADGTITMYGHMASSGVLVREGQKVTAGDVIALVGSEGFSTGPHLHFEVWQHGKKIDPAPWLAAHGIRMSAYTG